MKEEGREGGERKEGAKEKGPAYDTFKDIRKPQEDIIPL